jgi:DNA processing protein
MDSLTQIAKAKSAAPLGIPAEDLSTYLSETGASLIPSIFLETHLPNIEAQFPTMFYKGNLDLLQRPCVSIVGTRNPSSEGKARAKKVASVLVDLGFVVVSGLAKGIDTVAHETMLANNGFTAAVLGTPIHKIYPAENKPLAAKIEKSGIIISPSLPHEETGRYLFPRRNRLMASLSLATIIIEAGETSGVVHQASECLKQGRKLLLLKSLVDNKNLTWPAGFIKSGAHVVESPDDLKELLCK